jgi:hypothetical protein
MRRALAVLTVGVFSMIPASVFAASVDLRAGGFFPSSDASAPYIFGDEVSLYGIKKSDWYGATGGIQFNARIARNVEIGFNVDGYAKTLNTSYAKFTNPDGSAISQSLRLREIPTGVTLRLIPTTRRSHIAPFIGVGADLIFWKYEEYGNFIDFTPGAGLPVSTDSFQSTGATPGFHVEGGLRIPLSYDVSLVAQGKYTWAKTDMGGDFNKNRIDLGGASALIGVNIHF